MWIIGLQSHSSGSPVPESIRIAFRSFSDIRNPGSYIAPNRSLLPQETDESADLGRFGLKVWWVIREGETMGEPFDVRDEVVRGLLRAVEAVRKLRQLHRPSN